MKFMNRIVFCLIAGSFLNACVTTRAELNEKQNRNQASAEPSSDDRNSVKSEDITEPAPAKSTTVRETPPVANSAANPAGSTAASSTGAQPAHPAATSGNSADYGIEELRAEMAKLNGKVEELEHDKQTQQDTHLEEQKRLQAKIDELEKQLKEKEAQGPTVPEGKTAFEAGKDAYHDGKYQDAVVFFDEALKKSDKGKEAEEATYLEGDSNFKLKEYQKAIVTFSKFPEKYSKSSYHPKALLRIAEAFDAMGRKDDSVAFYSDLADRFPKTAEGKLAKKRLHKK